MAWIEIAERAEDAKRIAGHLLEHEAADIDEKMAAIFHAIETLADNPLIGRPVHEGLRELVIGRDAHGYLALYLYKPLDDTVYVLAIRTQRESGYAESLL